MPISGALINCIAYHPNSQRMGPPQPTKKRRTRKRKRKVSFDSSDSSSGDEHEHHDNPVADTLKDPAPLSSSSSSASTSSESSDDEQPSTTPRIPSPSQMDLEELMEKAATPPGRRSISRSPSPPPAAIPTIFDSSIQNTKPEDEGREDRVQEKFKKFWMAAVVDAFQNDLEHLRTVGRLLTLALLFSPLPQQKGDMTTDMLSLLIQSLASGADVYTHTQSSAPGQSRFDEMELVIDPKN